MNPQTEGWKQRRQEKLWKKVSSFVLSPASQLPDAFGPSSSFHAFCITGITRLVLRALASPTPQCAVQNASLEYFHLDISWLPVSISFAPRFHTPGQNLTTAGVRGKITKFVTTIHSASSTYHFYELEVHALDSDWLEAKEREREWVDYTEALRRISWKKELAQALKLSSMAPK